MGYRSDVVIVMKNSDWDRFAELAKEPDENREEIIKDIQCAEIQQDEKYTVICWDWFQWHDFRAGTIFAENFIRDIPHIFYRLGEDDNDYESNENFDTEDDYEMTNYVSLVRRIETNIVGKKIQI